MPSRSTDPSQATAPQPTDEQKASKGACLVLSDLYVQSTEVIPKAEANLEAAKDLVVKLTQELEAFKSFQQKLKDALQSKCEGVIPLPFGADTEMQEGTRQVKPVIK